MSDDIASDLATRIMALDWKARKDWTVEDQANRYGELQEMVDAALRAVELPRSRLFPAGWDFRAAMNAPRITPEDGGKTLQEACDRLDEWAAESRRGPSNA
jgi:hypothetical protein